jgi:gas vesicle protein
MFKALKSFCGKVSMKKGEIKDINDENIINDLLNAGYIEKIKENIKEEIKEVKEEVKTEVKEIEEKIEKEVKKTKTSKTSKKKK